MRFKARSSLDTYTLRSQRTAGSSHPEPPPTDPNFHQIISNFRPPIRSSQLYRRYKVRLRKRKGSETQPRVEQPSRQWRKARVDAPQRSSRALAHAIDTLDSRGFHVPARRHDTRAEQDRLRTRPTETGRGSASRGSSSRRREHGPNRHRRFDVVDTFLPPDRPRGNPSFGSRIILVLFSHSVTAIERVIRVNRSRWDVSRAPKCDSPVVCARLLTLDKSLASTERARTGTDLRGSRVSLIRYDSVVTHYYTISIRCPVHTLVPFESRLVTQDGSILSPYSLIYGIELSGKIRLRYRYDTQSTRHRVRLSV